MTLPRRRKPPKLGIREEPQIRCPGHLKWIRGHECSVVNSHTACTGRIEAAHVRMGTDGNLGTKPSDFWTIPLCSGHHAIQHNIGEIAFNRAYGINMIAIAQALWLRSPHRRKHEEDKA